jgi:hypothetical protein
MLTRCRLIITQDLRGFLHPSKKNKGMATMTGVFWDFTPRDSCKNRRFGGTQRFLRQVFTAVTMKSAVFWDVSPCGFYKN